MELSQDNHDKRVFECFYQSSLSISDFKFWHELLILGGRVMG